VCTRGAHFFLLRMSEDAFVDLPLKMTTIVSISLDVHRTLLRLCAGKHQVWTQSDWANHVVLIKDSQDTEFVFASNQRIRSVFIQNCQNCKILFLDSAVFVTRTLRVLDCSGLELVCEQVDLRRIECYNVTNSNIVEIKVEPVVENVHVFWVGQCAGNKTTVSALEKGERSNVISYYTLEESQVPDNTEEGDYMSYFNYVTEMFHAVFLRNGEFTPKGLERFNLLRGFVPETDCNLPDRARVLQLLEDHANVEFELTDKELEAAYDDERVEYFDSEDVLREKVRMLAKALQLSQHCVMFTGAGVSTSANIPGELPFREGEHSCSH
jgi:hypothetical protein